MTKVTITEVRNAKSLSADNNWFDVEINHPQYGWIPYGLTPHDTDQTVSNEELLALIGSDFAPYVPPTQEELDAKAAARVRAERDRRLETEVDPIAGNALRWAALTDEQRQVWANYRQALLDVPQQAGFPNEVVWPVKPA